MKNCLKLMSHEIFVLRHDPRVTFKLFISFMLIVYVLSFSLFDPDSTVLSYYFFGFFFVSPLIDYSFYTERVHKRFPMLLGRGFSLREIFVSKTLVIFFSGLLCSVIFSLAAMQLDRYGIIFASFRPSHSSFFFSIASFYLWMIITSGIIQVRFEMIFPVRLFNILAFLLFVNFQAGAASLDPAMNAYYSLCFLAASLLGFFLSGRLNKDMIG